MPFKRFFLLNSRIIVTKQLFKFRQAFNTRYQLKIQKKTLYNGKGKKLLQININIFPIENSTTEPRLAKTNEKLYTSKICAYNKKRIESAIEWRKHQSAIAATKKQEPNM